MIKEQESFSLNSSDLSGIQLQSEQTDEEIILIISNICIETGKDKYNVIVDKIREMYPLRNIEVAKPLRIRHQSRHYTDTIQVILRKDQWMIDSFFF